MTGEEFDKAIHAYETMKKDARSTSALHGLCDRGTASPLHEAGVTSYHHNIETSRRNFPNICTTHTYDMKINTLKMIKAEGMCACSGGIIGMGETWEDRLDMAVSLAELGIDSIPLNADADSGNVLWNIWRESLRTIFSAPSHSSAISIRRQTSASAQAARC